MKNIIITGHRSACPAPSAPCTCEAALYTLVGILGLVAGLTQWAVGYVASMAVLSDSLHAFSDTAADFWGAAIVVGVRSMKDYPVAEKRLDKLGNRVIALVLVFGAVLVGRQAIMRWSAGNYPVLPIAIIVVGIFGIVIDFLRWQTLSRARVRNRTSKRLPALIAHAQSDAMHSVMVAGIGVLTLAGVLLPIAKETYLGGIKLIDFIASLGLTVYMFYFAKKIWKGEGCGHDHTNACLDHRP